MIAELMACVPEWRMKTCARTLVLTACLAQIVYSFHPGSSFIPFGLTGGKSESLQIKVSEMERKQDAVEKSLDDFTNIVNKTVTEIQEADKEASVKSSELKAEMKKMSGELSGFKFLMGNVSAGLQIMKTKLKTGKPVTGCPVAMGYHLLNNKICLRLSEKRDNRTWEDSRRACQEEKGDLITFKDAAEQKEVQDYLNQLGEKAYSMVYPVMRIWVGMDKHTGFFTWVSDGNGTRQEFEGTWHMNSPHNNWILQCVSIVFDGLNDAMCNSKRRYLCRISMKNVTS